ncbi:MAG: NAD(P)H-hydrate dehydratase [Desulfobacterales bacterium]
MKVAMVSEMQEMDRTAIQRHGIPEILLMENAGLAAFRVLADELGIQGKRFAVVCGSGNNGGDGFVVARKIRSNGGMASVLVVGDPARYRGAARLNYELLENLSIPVETAPDPERVQAVIDDADGVVDAIFGTGLSKPVTGMFADVIDRINRSGTPVLSVDIPSGINGDTGRVMGTAIQAAFTVTFGLPKAGNLLYPGFHHCGRLFVSHISFPPELTASEHLRIEINDPSGTPRRSPWGHKSSFGDALFIAGAKGYYGAPVLAAMAFLKTGGGYSRLAVPESIAPVLAVRGREIVFMPQQETATGSISAANRAALLAAAETTDMTVIGPGLSLNEETAGLVRELVAAIERPVVIDGDGITAIAGNPELLKARRFPTALTPHPGEMARLSGMKTDQVLSDPIPILQDCAESLGATIVLKGAHSLIGTPDRRIYINLSGNDGMATAGSGDVLTGAIAAMHGLGHPFPEAVRKGVFIHGAAGDLAARSKGPDGITATDIMEALPDAMKRDRSADDGFRRHYDVLKVV